MISLKKKFQTNNLTLYLKYLEKEQSKPNVSKKMEIISIRAEIKEIEENKKNTELD